MLVNINHEQRLYVLSEGRGYSCLGFDVADQRMSAMAHWLEGRTVYAEQVLPASQDRGTIEHYARYASTLLAAGNKASSTGQRCSAELVPQLVGLEHKRIEVIDRYDQCRRFIVGKSMGWMPCHLEIMTSRSISGCAVTGSPFKSLTVLRD